MVNKYFFTAKWCPNCQLVKSTVESIKGVKIIDVEQYKEMVEKFSIMSLPFYVIEYEDSFESMGGAKPEEIIKKFYDGKEQ